MSIRFKLVSLFLVIGILPLLVVVGINYLNTKEGVEQNVNNSKEIINKELDKELRLILDIKKNSIESFFKHMDDQVIALSQNKMIVNAAKDFKQSFYKYSEEAKDRSEAQKREYKIRKLDRSKKQSLIVYGGK